MDGVTLVIFVLGFVFLIVGAEWLVRGAAHFAVSIGISSLVVGLTVVAFGTSAPELGVSLTSSILGQGDLAVGNVVGSNICNVLLILGLSSLAAPLLVSPQLLRIEVPLMLGVSILGWWLALDGLIGRWDGILLFIGVLMYTVWAIRRSRKENGQHTPVQDMDLTEPCASAGCLVRQVLLILAGLVLLGVGSHWLVLGAKNIARALGVSELIIGLTIVSLGTSLPELATSVMASLRGHRDIAVGNIVGSNLFNILMVLGLTAAVVPEGVSAAPQALHFDFPIMVLVMLACVPVFFTGYQISRVEGAIFFVCYVGYTLVLALNALGYAALPSLNLEATSLVLPLMFGLIALACIRNFLTSK